ncbi:hypothetical protein C8E03_1135 [Lachnotalea glycerini]|uniref:Uncharacterized protein n=1 Tax=Lachnotalea glycerini TaxID=1763509 RepID=A0A318ESC6_9FIRM|nr:hypothetical protein [Lachnotalea glycerini]PXV86221.1 hypothetical protein C8E03_1135 [Lachnotalea glycerini]
MKFLKTFTSFILICAIIICNTIPTFAETSTTIVTSKNVISDETAKKIAIELITEFGTIDTFYLYNNIESKEIITFNSNTKGKAISTGVKTVIKFLKKNATKIEKILKKYGVTLATGKGISSAVDQLLDGVISVDDSIDSAIYAVVDFVIPDASNSTKKIISNAIRLVCPI